MQIKKLHIISFGKLQNEQISFKPGFNYYYGPNEAGKTTIRMFITYVLFGLKKDERNPYISKHDGQLGGRLYLTIDGDEWVVERFLHRNSGKPVIYENGAEVTEAELQKALKGLDRFLFESIFSFQDRDLQTIRNETPDSIGKILFNLGMTGSDKVANVEKELKKVKDELFKFKGKKQAIYLKLKELDDLAKKMKELEQTEASYSVLQNEKTENENKLNELLNQEEQLNETSLYYQKLLNGKSAIVDYQWYDGQLKNFDHVKHFSNEVIESFKNLQDHLSKLKRDDEEKEARLHSLQSEIQSLLPSTDYSIQELNELTKDAFDAKNILKQIEELNEQIAHDNYLLDELLQEASLPLSKNDLEQLNINLYTESHWKKLIEDEERLDNSLQSIDAKRALKEDEKNDLLNEMTALSESMLSEEEYDSLKEKENEYVKQKSLAPFQDNVIDEWKRRLKQLNKERQLLNILKPSFLIGAALIIISYFIFFFSNTTLDYSAIIVILAISVVSIFLITKSDQKKLSELNRLNERLKQLNPVDAVNFNENDARQIKNYEEQREEWAQLKMKQDQVETTLQELQSEKLTIVERHKRHQLQVEKVIADYPFLKAFELFQWPNVHQTLTKAKQISKKIAQLESDREILEQTLNEKKDFANKFISHFKSIERQESQSVWDVFNQCIENEKRIKEEINKKTEWINEITDQRKQIKLAMVPYENELNALLLNMNVENEKQFLNWAEQYEQYVDVLYKKKQAYKMVYSIFGEQADAVLKKSYDWMQLERQYDQINEEMKQCKEAYQNVQQSLSDCLAEMNQLEKDGTLSEFVHKKAAIIEEVKELAMTYSIYAVAEGFILDTKERYQNVYLPEIIRYATSFFSEITDGAYKKIRFSLEDETIYVENENADSFTVKQLSEGTADQLYVSLRLAISSVINDLLFIPFILDDAFNHFDKKRKRKMLKILKEISHKQQIIYLTCTELSQEDIA